MGIIIDDNNPYDFDCGYGWIYNDPEYEAGGALQSSSTWLGWFK